MADPDTGADEQDQAEVFDEDNTNPSERGPGEDAEQFEDLVDVFDVTARAGDADEDEPEIGEDLDDDEIVASARDNDDDDDDLEDDDLVRSEEIAFSEEEDLTSVSDPDEADAGMRDATRAGRPGDGFVKAIESVAEPLARHFPPGSGNTHAFPDHLVVLD